MSRKRSADWPKIKAEYISNKEATYKSLAEKFGVSYAYLARMAAQEKWVEQRAKRWAGAEKKAIEEVEGSIKDLIVRHSRAARYLQVGGLKNLKLLLDEVEERMRNEDIAGARQVLKTLIANKIITAGTLTTMIDVGMKGERELYPKQMKIETDAGLILAEASPELKEAMNEALKRRLRAKPREPKESKPAGRD